jgi:hypothetical protein
VGKSSPNLRKTATTFSLPLSPTALNCRAIAIPLRNRTCRPGPLRHSVRLDRYFNDIGVRRVPTPRCAAPPKSPSQGLQYAPRPQRPSLRDGSQARRDGARQVRPGTGFAPEGSARVVIRPYCEGSLRYPVRSDGDTSSFLSSVHSTPRYNLRKRIRKVLVRGPELEMQSTAEQGVLISDPI